MFAEVLTEQRPRGWGCQRLRSKPGREHQMQKHRSGRNRGNARLRGKVGKDWNEVGKHQRPNPKGPHVMTRSRCRALPCRQWGVFAHLAQGANCSPFQDSIQCHFGEPFPGSADAAGSVLPGLQGPHGTPFISHLILHSHDLLFNLTPPQH